MTLWDKTLLAVWLLLTHAIALFVGAGWQYEVGERRVRERTNRLNIKHSFERWTGKAWIRGHDIPFDGTCRVNLKSGLPEKYINAEWHPIGAYSLSKNAEVWGDAEYIYWTDEGNGHLTKLRNEN